MNGKNVEFFGRMKVGKDRDHSPMAPNRELDFGFAFNDSKFSDRLLRIEIMADLPEARPDTLCVGDEDVDNNGENYWNMDGLIVQQVKTFHISSPILAAKSLFFSKLFSKGMMESEQKSFTLRINASEEAAFLELLNFMYSNKLSVFTPSAVLNVLMAADKFEVASCTWYCSHLLHSFPMTPESALVYLDLPHSVLMNEAVQPLTDAAKQFIAAHYKDIATCQKEVMNLPLAGIEAILASDDLHVASEDVVYDIALKWARTHYPTLEERQEILGSRLAPLIRFPLMSCRKLRNVLTCNDFNTEVASKVVLEALFFKSESLHHQRNQAPGDASSTHRFVDRAYKYRPVKVIELELPQAQCVVYMDLKRKECEALFPSGRLYSQSFHLGGQGFFLSAHCNMDPQNSMHCFGLFLGMKENGSVSLAVDYEFSARSKPTEEFMPKYKGTYTFSSSKAVGYRNLLGISWSSFMSDESQYFINNNLHLRAELTMKSQVLHINPEMS
ncbi:hypothetical protein LIER_27702 [Lithospermum erythrorhizon]|uniref:BTB domain-containing protein n=1 Tax=Lithospermum erythrorhizon TaxID=34254 RepID=A0AAV3RGM1_LITER